MNKLEAIKQFLEENSELGNLFNHEMECQVNVDPTGGTKFEDTFNGHKYSGWEDESGLRWKHLRIPYRANTESPNYVDGPLRFPVSKFFSIGLTGWNWVKQQSHWVGFDFDSITTHVRGLDDNELSAIRKAVESVEWVEIRKSTSGKGLHLYIHLDTPIRTESHTLHAALARSILALLSAQIGSKLESKVDTCGGILWIWSKKQSEDGFSLIKAGSKFPSSKIPENWKEQVEVVSGRKKLIKSPCSEEEPFNELVNKTKVSKLDDEHRKLMGFLAQTGAMWWWDHDRNILVAHTFDLAIAHKSLGFKGTFYTSSTGKDQGRDQNCFAFPLPRGGWVVRRHSRRTAEHPCWSIDSGGWTRTYLNCPATIEIASRCHGGQERSDGQFEFQSVNSALAALKDLGAVTEEIDSWLLGRVCSLKPHKDGRIILIVEGLNTDPQAKGFLRVKGRWERIISVEKETQETELQDELIRQTIENGKAQDWFLFTRNQWIIEGENNIKKALKCSGTKAQDVDKIMGQYVYNPWTVISKPFQPEYPGNRLWNRNAPQFAVEPREGSFTTWTSIIGHLGSNLDEAVACSQWCIDNGILTGPDYLYLWLASLFQYPTEPLPYLFFYSSKQNTGKSTLQEALRPLFKDGIGFKRADQALKSQGNFNGELKGQVLCIIEETNLQTQKEAYNRIKDWVTSRTISIHEKGKTPFDAYNHTHFIQTSNEPDACPIFPGDTRIVVIHVPQLEKDIPLPTLLSMLEVENAAFLYHLLHIQIPPSDGRLRIPVVTSADKLELMQSAESLVEKFFKVRVIECTGHVVSLSELYDCFIAWLDHDRRKSWPYQRFNTTIPPQYIRGTYNGSYYHLANVSLDREAKPKRPLKRVYNRLVEV